MLMFTAAPGSNEELVTIADLAEESPNVLNQWLADRGEAMIDLLVRIVIALVLFFIVTRILKYVLKLLEKSLNRHKVEETAKQFILTLVRISVLTLTVVTIVVQLNIVEASSIAALIASAGVAISLAMQGALSNFAGGILLMLNKPFRAGDYIIVKGADVEGTVEKIEIYYTTIRTLAGERILIPNSTLTGQSVVNQAQNGTKVLILRVGISYEEDIAKAKAVLQSLLEGEPRIQESLRRVVVDELGESQVTMMCIARVKAVDYNNVRFDLNERIRGTFREKGIEIPYNQLDVHIHS
ncbi:MAG: mechanosensitive ion channel [Lachnospiraceae bacterium]|nr:mechanosensitive ion channel [Lachnospiraceae bacterium]